jgi:cathepsin L
MSAVYEYIIGNNGTEAASTYKLRDVQFPCKFNATRAKAFLKSYGYIIGDEEVLKRALAAIGPLSVGMNGENDSIYNYWKGVYDDPVCTGNINHAVLLVGYGTDKRQFFILLIFLKFTTNSLNHSYSPPLDYWILKNSWGTSW